jgi:hypothetical protein
VIALGRWFYAFCFKSAAAAIRHADAFLFRRMTVMQPDKLSLLAYSMAGQVVVDPFSKTLNSAFPIQNSTRFS